MDIEYPDLIIFLIVLMVWLFFTGLTCSMGTIRLLLNKNTNKKVNLNLDMDVKKYSPIF